MKSRLTIFLRELDKAADKYCEKVANTIGDLAQENFDRASHFVSGRDPETMVYVVKAEDKWCVKAVGEQVAFIEFGTGVFNEKYPIPADRIPAYTINIQPNVMRGKLGKGNGRKRAWGFYGRASDVATAIGNSSGKMDFVVSADEPTDEKRHYYGDKRFITSGAAKDDVIITYGLNPQRCLFNAIRDARRELLK